MGYRKNVRWTLEQLQNLTNDLGIKATIITETRDGFEVDWNGEVENFSTAIQVAKALNAAAN
jgi:hypothetical protein